jgi:hypothetical protein
MYVLVLMGFMISFPGTYNAAFGQNYDNMVQAEDSLAAILTLINQTKDDSLRLTLNNSFADVLKHALMLPESAGYPFQLLKSLVKITAPDNKFSIYQWNLPDNQGNHTYFGFIKTLKSESVKVFPLKDFADSLPNPDTAHLDNLHWFGALYYKIISCVTEHGKQYYTLLGWAGKNAVITQKIIEVLNFDDQDVPKFGLSVFPDFESGKMTRIIFRYSASTSMSLKYEDQIIATQKKWNAKKRVFEFKTRTAKMIVCDRLVPLDPQLDGQYQFYVAAGDVFDGFEFRNGCWNYEKGIDSRNKE